jgi:hypothetical protein
MEKLHFTAEVIENVLNEFDILCVGFFNSEEEHYLMIQYEENPDEDDTDLDLNTYHIERDDQSYGNYGGVKQIILSPNQLMVIPDEQGIENLACSEIIIDFETDSAQFAILTENLQKIFGEAFVLKKQ